MSLIVVQRGHVPRTSGATGAPGEQQFAIDTAAKLAPLLRDMGHEVRIINADEPRSKYAGDLFVSIHYDSASSPSAHGASVGYQNDAGARFAAAWKRAYREAGWTRDFRSDNYSVNLAQYYGVREAIAAGNKNAIITESGFHTNVGDKALMSPARTARSIALAVGELTNTALPEEDDMAGKGEEIYKLLTDTLTISMPDGTKKEITPRQAFDYLQERSLRLEDKLDEVLAELKKEGTAS